MVDLLERVAKLRALAADSAASDNERMMARAVAERLERRAKVEAAHKATVIDEDPIWDSRGRVRQADAWRRISSLDGTPIDAPWPTGWTGPRARAEFEAALNGDEFVVNWDCPSCGMVVAKAVPLRYIYRMIGAKADPLDAIRGMMDGRTNQLCEGCTRKHGG